MQLGNVISEKCDTKIKGRSILDWFANQTMVYNIIDIKLKYYYLVSIINYNNIR